MKKYFIGVAIGIVFLAYSLVLRSQHSEPIVPSNNSSSSNTKNSATSSAGSSTGNSSTPSTPSSSYKDGEYDGSVANAYYGNVQIAVDISGGKITNVKFLQTPDENPNSISVNSQATPYLAQEAIKAQSANVSIVTGATFTSQAFIQSLMSALSKAK